MDEGTPAASRGTIEPTGCDVVTDRVRLAAALRRLGNGDDTAFDELHALTVRMLFGVCIRVCGNREAAEDILHDVYVIVLRRAASYDPSRGSPATWLAAIARNRAIDWRRRQALRWTANIDVAIAIADTRPDAETVLIADEEIQALHRFLAALKPYQRDAIREAFFDGSTYAEIAARRAVPLSTMKSWIRRGLGRLQVQLSEE